MTGRALRRVGRFALPAIAALGVFAPHATAATRHVWVAAVPVQWDVVTERHRPDDGHHVPEVGDA